jgi:hypothetical protein
VYIVVNAVVMALEAATVIGLAWLGYHHPYVFAALTAGLAFLLGLKLEAARIRHEVPFYFGTTIKGVGLLAGIIGFGGSVVKALVAGVAALLTFAGTNADRLYWVAVIFAVGVFAGASLLRRLRLTFGAIPSRWGFFRLAVPLGILFSLALVFLPVPSLGDLARTVLLDTPPRPSIEQASEVLFLLKQKFDEIVAGLLSWLLPAEAARFAGALVSVNVLTGFAIAVHASVIASIVATIEDRGH